MQIKLVRFFKRLFVYFFHALSKKKMFNHLKILFSSPAPGPAIRVIKNRKDISKAVFNCVDSNTVLGIYCPAIADGLLLVGIESISTDGFEPIVTMRPYDLNGILLQRNQIAMSEIRSVCVFDSVYENPLFKKEQAVNA